VYSLSYGALFTWYQQRVVSFLIIVGKFVKLPQLNVILSHYHTILRQKEVLACKAAETKDCLEAFGRRLHGCIDRTLLPGPDKHSRPHSPKTAAIFEAFMATYQKICPCMIFLNTLTIINIYYYSRPLLAPPISHRELFFYTACFELFSGGHGHLAFTGVLCRKQTGLDLWTGFRDNNTAAGQRAC
jgi:hypothetical protein